MAEELKSAVEELREDDALALVDRLLAEGADPVDILDQSKRAMDVIGERFACGEAFIPELIMAGEIMQRCGELSLTASHAPEERGTESDTAALTAARDSAHGRPYTRTARSRWREPPAARGPWTSPRHTAPERREVRLQEKARSAAIAWHLMWPMTEQPASSHRRAMSSRRRAMRSAGDVICARDSRRSVTAYGSS